MSWTECLEWSGSEWYAWALLVPFVMQLAARYRFDIRARLPVSIFLHAIGLTLFVIAQASLQTIAVMYFRPNLFDPIPDFRTGVVRTITTDLHWEVMSYLLVVAATQVGLYLRRLQAEALARRDLEIDAARAQLGALKRQMQPHFLFNALHALVAMLAEDSPGQRFTIRLADMLRILLAGSEQSTATLREELILVDAYLHIEHARFDPMLRTRIEIEEDLLDLRLPSFVLQPLVENAITHGIGRLSDGGDILVCARKSGLEAIVEVTNSCEGVEAESTGATGQGLTHLNCRRRLELMYGRRARFEAEFVETNVFRAAIVLPLTHQGDEYESTTNPDRGG
jgi:hypothetical protein